MDLPTVDLLLLWKLPERQSVVVLVVVVEAQARLFRRLPTLKVNPLPRLAWSFGW